jgi:WD40 repeat protein
MDELSPGYESSLPKNHRAVRGYPVPCTFERPHRAEPDHPLCWAPPGVQWADRQVERFAAPVAPADCYRGNVHLWDVGDLRRPSLLGTLAGHANAVFAVAFSSDGRTLATASDDTTARLWDIRDPHRSHLLGTLTGHAGSVYSVAFSQNHHTLATASLDNTARLWETDAETVATQICNITWPPITQSEWNHYLSGLPYQPPCP